MVSLRNRLLVGCALFGIGLGGVTLGVEAVPAEAVPASADGAFFESQIDPTADTNFSLALFRLWLPQKKSPVSGVLAVFPISDGDGTPLVDDPPWQAIACAWNYALLAGAFTTSSRGLPYYRAESGSGQALLSALDQMATASGHSPALRSSAKTFPRRS